MIETEIGIDWQTLTEEPVPCEHMYHAAELGLSSHGGDAKWYAIFSCPCKPSVVDAWCDPFVEMIQPLVQRGVECESCHGRGSIRFEPIT